MSHTKPPNCTCQYPRLIARNMHGHGNDPQGNPCPVGVAWEAHNLFKKNSNAIPRRNYVQLRTPAEQAIADATQAVEKIGADPLLTDAVVLLGQAYDKVADYTDAQARIGR